MNKVLRLETKFFENFENFFTILFSRETILGALIDAKLSEMDTEQIEYTQLNQKLLQCLHLYDTLMQQEQFSNPYMLNQQMGNMSLQVFLSSRVANQLVANH